MTAPSNVQNTGTGATNYTSLTSATYTVASGNNKRLVVWLALWYPTNSSLPSSPTITHNGVAMTLQRTSQSNNANGGGSSNSTLYLFDLVLGSTTPSGIIAASWTPSIRCLMTAATLTDVQQSTAPTLASSQSLGSDSVASASTDVVIDGVLNASQNTTTGYAISINTGQTSLANTRVNPGAATEGNLGVSYATTTDPASTSMGWSGNVSLGPRAQHIVAGYQAAVTGATATGSPTITISASGNGAQVNPAATASASLTPLASATAAQVNPVASAAATLTLAASGGAQNVNPQASATASLKPSASGTGAQINPVASASPTITLVASGNALHVNPVASMLASLAITGTGTAFAGVIVPPTISHRLGLNPRGNLTIRPRAPLVLPAT